VVDRRRLNSVRCPDSELLTAPLELGPACQNCDDSGWKVVERNGISGVVRCVPWAGLPRFQARRITCTQTAASANQRTNPGQAKSASESEDARNTRATATGRDRTHHGPLASARDQAEAREPTNKGSLRLNIASSNYVLNLAVSSCTLSDCKGAR
jgi:hypothetical protein